MKCEYLLRAFGFKKISGGYDVDTLKEDLLRDKDTGVSHFITSPYRDISENEVQYYIFERTDDIVEVENATAKIADALDEIR